jgi:hypothetical protein
MHQVDLHHLRHASRDLRQLVHPELKNDVKGVWLQGQAIPRTLRKRRFDASKYDRF